MCLNLHCVINACVSALIQVQPRVVVISSTLDERMQRALEDYGTHLSQTNSTDYFET